MELMEKLTRQVCAEVCEETKEKKKREKLFRDIGACNTT